MSYLQKNEQQSILPQMPYADACRASDIADVCVGMIDRANAALPRVTGLVGKPEPEVSALTGDHPISQKEASDD